VIHVAGCAILQTLAASRLSVSRGIAREKIVTRFPHARAESQEVLKNARSVFSRAVLPREVSEKIARRKSFERSRAVH
jgi:hypothetical protein